MAVKYDPLTRKQVKDAIEGRGAPRPPANLHKWPGDGLCEYHGEEAVKRVFACYPDDVVVGGIVQPGGWEAPEGFPADYRWACKDQPETDADTQAGIDSGGRIIETWDDLDAFIETFPKADNPAIFDGVRQAVAGANGHYVEARAWNNFYERLWGLRGMQNVLMDFLLYPKQLQTLCEALLELVLKFVDGAAEAGADGFSTSNDLGHQTGLMMSPASFREILKPLHVRVARACHERGMHYWMHSCGDLTDILADLIEAGVDCLHPIQYGAMDWKSSARIMAGRMTAWPGVDVQHTLQESTPAGVRGHVRELIDTFHQPGQGRCVVGAGNGMTGSTPLENIDAFLDETFRYGLSKESA